MIYHVFSEVPTRNLIEPKLYMNPTKNLIEPTLYMNHTKTLKELKLYMNPTKNLLVGFVKSLGSIRCLVGFM
jgi:hypothetical protein